MQCSCQHARFNCIRGLCCALQWTLYQTIWIRVLMGCLCCQGLFPLMFAGKENRIGPAVPQQHEQPAQAGSSAEHQQQQAQQPGYVACPICSSSVKETFINSHIDSCLARMSSGEQRQQRSAGRTSTTAGKRPAAAAAVGTKPRVAPPQTVTADSVVTGNNIPGGSDGGKLGSCRITTAAGGVGASSSGVGVRRVRLKALEPPPKLCFDLLKDKDLKGKLTQLGLSSEGGKKVRCSMWCVIDQHSLIACVHYNHTWQSLAEHDLHFAVWPLDCSHPRALSKQRQYCSDCHLYFQVNCEPLLFFSMAGLRSALHLFPQLCTVTARQWCYDDPKGSSS